MKISITQGGTIVPVLTTTEVDSEALAPNDAAALRGLVERAGISGGHRPGRGAAQPDRGGYRITLEDGGRKESLSVPDADLRPETRALVDWVTGHPKATQRVEPLGG
jgi:hypothetical protein